MALLNRYLVIVTGKQRGVAEREVLEVHRSMTVEGAVRQIKQAKKDHWPEGSGWYSYDPRVYFYDTLLDMYYEPDALTVGIYNPYCVAIRDKDVLEKAVEKEVWKEARRWG